MKDNLNEKAVFKRFKMLLFYFCINRIFISLNRKMTNLSFISMRSTIYQSCSKSQELSLFINKSLKRKMINIVSDLFLKETLVNKR